MVGDSEGQTTEGSRGLKSSGHLWNVQAKHFKKKNLICVKKISSYGVQNYLWDRSLWQEHRTRTEKRCNQTRKSVDLRYLEKRLLMRCLGGVWAGSSRKQQGKSIQIAQQYVPMAGFLSLGIQSHVNTVAFISLLISLLGTIMTAKQLQLLLVSYLHWSQSTKPWGIISPQTHKKTPACTLTLSKWW